jgi:hypothetical protein
MVSSSYDAVYASQGILRTAAKIDVNEIKELQNRPPNAAFRLKIDGNSAN